MPVSDATYRTAAPPERLTARMSQILRCSAVSASCFLNTDSSYLPLSHKYRDVNYGIFTWEGSHLKEKYICWSADKCVMMLERLIEAHFTPCWARVHDGSSVTLTDFAPRKGLHCANDSQYAAGISGVFLHVLSSETQFSVTASPALKVGVKLEAIPGVFGRRQVLTLDKSLVYRRATQKGKQPVSLTHKDLRSNQNSQTASQLNVFEMWEEAGVPRDAGTGWTCKLHTERGHQWVALFFSLAQFRKSILVPRDYRSHGRPQTLIPAQSHKHTWSLTLPLTVTYHTCSSLTA